MTAREARRVALLILLDEGSRSLDVSDEWERHPETDQLLSRDDGVRVRSQARAFLRSLERRAARLKAP